LNSKQKQYLKGLAQNLDPMVQIGKNGLTEASLSTIEKALNDHELIKVKFLYYKGNRQEISNEIIMKTKAEFVEIIGNILILYKESGDINKSKIVLPKD